MRPSISSDDLSSVLSGGQQDSESNVKEADDADGSPDDAAPSKSQQPRPLVFNTFSGDDEATGPPIELVHVSSLRARVDFHTASALLPGANAHTTELMFSVELDDLLVGDLVESFVEQQAIYLVQGLAARIAARQAAGPADNAETKPKPKPVFALIAYDLGAAIVKTAVWFAAKHPDIFPDVFSRTFTVVFSGCPQRAPDGDIGMERVLWKMLGEKMAEKRGHHLISLSLQSLARLMIRTSGLFAASKMTLRCRVASVHANELKPGEIDLSITTFVGSLGIPTEILVREETEGYSPYSYIGSWVMSNYDGFLADSYRPAASTSALTDHRLHSLAIPRIGWEDINDTLLYLAPPHTLHSRTPALLPSSLEGIRTHPEFIRWRDHSGVQLLYIAEPSGGPAMEVADGVISALAESRNRPAKPIGRFYTSFDTYHDGIPSMVASVLAHGLTYRLNTAGVSVSEVIRNQSIFRNGWNCKSSLNILEPYRSALGQSSVLVLQNFDQCRKQDREIFLRYLCDLRERSEWRCKIIITSTIPNVLTEELGSWSVLKSDDLAKEAAREKFCEPSTMFRHFPTDRVSNLFKSELRKLEKTNTGLTQEVVRLLGECSGWPSEASTTTLAEFHRLLRTMATRTGAAGTLDMVKALDSIIRSRAQVKGFYLALSLLLNSHRPLSFRELIFLGLYPKESRTVEPPGQDLDLAAIWNPVSSNSLEQSLRGLIDGNTSGHTQLRPEIRQLMGDTDEAYIWNDSSWPSHGAIFDLCYSLVICEGSRDTLESISGAQGFVLDPFLPVSPGMLLRRELIQYAIRALPHHLKKCPESIDSVMTPASESTGAALLAWAQAYWATSSPLLRLPERPQTHLSILSMFGIGTYTQLSRDESFPAAAALGSQKGFLATWLQSDHTSIESLTDVLASAVQAGNEATALDIANVITSRHRGEGVWPVKIFRASVWNHMSQLVDLLLAHGVNANSREDYALIESELGYAVAPPLYSASTLGLIQTFDALVQAGATVGDAVYNQTMYLGRAALHGDPDMVRAVLRQPLDVQSIMTDEVLAGAASLGNWRTCQVLLDEGGEVGLMMDKEGVSKQRALAEACAYGHIETIKQLLEHGTDPNVTVPEGYFTPLGYAALAWSSLPMVRLLLSHGADPNAFVQGGNMLSLLPEGVDDDRLVSIYDTLLSHDSPIDINARDGRGWTMLIAASHLGRLAIVNWLIDKGAEVDAVTIDLDSALSLSVYQKRSDVVMRLLQEHPNLERADLGGTPPIFYALPNLDILTTLLSAGSNVEAADGQGRRLIHHAAANGHHDVVSRLIDLGVDINALDAHGRPPIWYAVEQGTTSIFRLLAARGAVLTSSNSEASLLHAAITRSADMLRVVLEFIKFLDLDSRDSGDMTPLMAARTDIECWKLMLYAGADPHAVADRKWTALHLAVQPGMAQFRSVLLSQPGINIECGGIFGPPLLWACGWLDMEAVRDLIAMGANVHAKPPTPGTRYATPLVATLHSSFIVMEGAGTVETKKELIRLLILKGCDVQDEMPGSLLPEALSNACLVAMPELVQLLLDEGALANKCSPVGSRYPLHYAAASGIGNFKLIHDVHDGDMMVADAGKKHCLHWAAQSGNTQTIAFILDQLRARGDDVSRYINDVDIDGWSPLCWAIRPFKDSRRLISESSTETSDTEGTVRLLLDEGADPAIKCFLGSGDQEETLSVLDIARRRGAGSAVIGLLKSEMGLRGRDSGSGGDDDTKDESPSPFGSWTCDICFTIILESRYNCTDCELWCACAKCYRNIKLYHHAETQNDGKSHSFTLAQGEPRRNSPQEPDEVHGAGVSAIQSGSAVETGGEVISGPWDDGESLDLSEDDET